MKIEIKNKWNIVPLILNVLWTLVLLYAFIIKVPIFNNQKPDGASLLILGLFIMTIYVFIFSLLYIIVANLIKRMKVYYDLHFAFISITVVILTVIFNNMINL